MPDFISKQNTAQSNASRPAQNEQKLGLRLIPISLPETNGAWATQMVSWGGYGGIRTGNLVVTSEGKASLRKVRQIKELNLSHGEMGRLKKITTSMNVEGWRKITDDYCRDCITTVLALYRRGVDGHQQTNSLVWMTQLSQPCPRMRP